MKKKNNFRANVMKYAYQIWNSTRQNWSDCMKKAWSLYRFVKHLKSGVVGFAYKKVDGTVRNAYGTLSNIYYGSEFGTKKFTKPSYKTIVYFDVEKNAFRSFKVENLISRF